MIHNVAHLVDSSPFRKVFPNGIVPIINVLVPTTVECIGDGVQPVYMVDLKKLSPTQFDVLAEMVVKQCDPGYPIDKAKDEMRAQGLPLRAKHVAATSSSSMHFL